MITMAYMFKKLKKLWQRLTKRINLKKKCEENKFKPAKLKRQQQLKPMWPSVC